MLLLEEHSNWPLIVPASSLLLLLLQLLLLQQLLLLELLQPHLLQQPCLLHGQARCLAARALPRSPRGQCMIPGWHPLLLLLEQQLLPLL